MRSEEKINEQTQLISSLTNNLHILRATIGISQGELAEYVGISRQTYCALEQGKRTMSWTVFLSLFLFFISNAETNNMMKNNKGFIAQVYQFLQYKPDEKSIQYPNGIDNNY